MKFVYAFLIVLACFIPVLIGAGFGLEALIGYCTSNSTCLSVEVCRNAKCKDPCDSTTCGQNARCLVNNHTAVCECLPQYKGDPTWRCEKRCEFDSECAPHATCHPLEYGVAVCKCKPGYRGDPWTNCERYCTNDDECDSGDVCNGAKCVNACKEMQCGRNALCKVIDNVPSCQCENCFRGNPYHGCQKINSPECRKNNFI